MPDLTGAEILRVLKSYEKLKHTPKIIWITSNSMQFRSLSVEHGPDDYIVKPSTINGLKNAAIHMLSFCK